MKGLLPSPGSRQLSPASPRKAASSPPYGLAQCSVSDVVKATESSPLSRRRDSSPIFTWLTRSESTSTLADRDHCQPYWEGPSELLCSYTEPPHEPVTSTDEQLASPSSEDLTSAQGEDDDTNTLRPTFDFKWRTPSALVSLSLLAFVLGLVVITAITGTVNSSKMEKLEVVPDLHEMEEAHTVARKDVTSASVGKTTMRWLRSAKAKARNAAKRTRTTTTKPRAAGHRRTVAFLSKRRPTNVVRLAATRTWSLPNISRRSRQRQRTLAATTTKRRGGRFPETTSNNHREEVTRNRPVEPSIDPVVKGVAAATRRTRQGRSKTAQVEDYVGEVV